MELALGEVAVALLVVAAGAGVRGLTGFGASLIWVSGLTLVMDPDELRLVRALCRWLAGRHSHLTIL